MNIKEIVLKHKNRKCLHCDGRLDHHSQCYNCKKYVYDAEYWDLIERILGVSGS